MSHDLRDYRAAFSRCVELAEEWQSLDFEPATGRDLAILTTINRCGRELAAALVPDEEPAPKRKARKPHPNTMAGQ